MSYMGYNLAKPVMSNKKHHVQDEATPTEASRDIKDWYKSDSPCNTRQDEDKNGSHIHFQLLEEDERTIKGDSNGKTDIVQRVYWPNYND